MTRHVDIIGHRGARGLFPENTLEGFQLALALGVRWFELDVGVTADGVVVVHHDLALNPAIARDASGRWIEGTPPAIHALTFDASRTYDVGRIRPGTSYGLLYLHQKGQDDVRIPTFESVLRLSAEAHFIVELKTDPRHPGETVSPEAMAAAVLAVIDAVGAADRVVIESFDWRGPQYIRRIRPAMPLAWLTRDETVRDAALWWGDVPRWTSIPAAVAAQGGQMGGHIWAPAWDSLTKVQVAEAHELGLRVVPWTVNRRTAMRRLIGWGVDGLITDRPDAAIEETRR